MQYQKPVPGNFFAITVVSAFLIATASAVTLTNPIVFVTQPPIAHENNGSVSNTFLSVVTIFGNQLADTTHAARGGDLWLMTTNGSLVNLTRKAGFGTNGIQHGIGIDVRDPQIHWLGKKVLFSMVVGAPVNAADTTKYFWQLYECTNLDAVIADTNTAPKIIPVAGQPANCDNVTPCYATDGRIIFMSDMAYSNFTALDEYKGQPAVTGIYSLDPAGGGALKMIEHLPSGAFNPFIDSFGRLIVTRWDHLSQDPLAADDRLGILNLGQVSFNGSFNYLSETTNASAQATNIIETFPEPRKFDTNYDQALGVNGNDFNLFLPWALDQDGGDEEVLNHVGRHELFVPSASTGVLLQSFTGDTNLFSLSNLVQRAASGVVSANTNFLAMYFQITEDPRTNGLYWGVNTTDISPFGGNHASGQILTLTGAPGVNPVNMVATAITSGNTGAFRNPLPMSDGTLIAAFSTVNPSFNFGVDTNTGTASLPVSQFNFRLMTLTNANPLWKTSQFVTGGIQNTSIYYANGALVTNNATLWELQPVEVRAKQIPTPVKSGVTTIEQAVFAQEGVDLPTFQADLAQRGLALVISRNVTARDAADKQQPYNLRVPGGTNSIANNGKVYDITHLQYLQADYLRGYSNGWNGVVQPGRRVLPVPMHAAAGFNYASSVSNAPVGSTELMSDGSQATIIPANRAVTWQLIGTNYNIPISNSVVKERYWISFRPGEVRTCANCHGINAVDQLGRSAPTNAPLALVQLLRLWRTNSVGAYALTVNNGNGGGNFGAGTILTLTAGPAPSGTYFAGWTGAAVSNSAASATLFIMPTNSATVTAVFASLPSPVLNSGQIRITGTNVSLVAQAYPNQPWVLQSSTNLIDWVNLLTNSSDNNGVYSNSFMFNPPSPNQFFRLKSP